MVSARFILYVIAELITSVEPYLVLSKVINASHICVSSLPLLT